MNAKTLTTLLIIAAIAVAAAVYFAREKPASPGAPTPAAVADTLFPDLARRLDDVASITVLHAGKTFEARKVDGKWVMASKGGYPANPDHPRKLLVALAELGKLEEKTSVPDLYAKLGVEDPATAPPPAPVDPASAPPPSSAAMVTLRDAQGAEIAKVIVGNDKWGTPTGTYVRKPGDARSYFAQPRVELLRDVNAWMFTQFLNIPRDRARSVSVHNAAKETIVAERESPEVPTFAIKDIPPGRELKSGGSIEQYASLLTYVWFEDVAKADDPAFAGEPTWTASARTYDGLIVTIRGHAKDDKAWWIVQASADPEWTPPAAPAPDPSKPEDKPKPSRTKDDVDKEVADLNAKWSGWAFQVPKAKADVLRNTWDDLLKTTAVPAESLGPKPGATPPPPPPEGDSSLVKPPGHP